MFSVTLFPRLIQMDPRATEELDSQHRGAQSWGVRLHLVTHELFTIIITALCPRWHQLPLTSNHGAAGLILGTTVLMTCDEYTVYVSQ